VPELRELRELVPAAEPGREVDDWGRSQRVFDLIEPLLDFYYRYWFRAEVEGIENVPSEGGALIVSNHSGALMRAGVPIVPVALIGAEEAMPIFAQVPLLERLSGLLYLLVNHAFPQFGLAAALMYLPAKFKIRFLEPVDLSRYGRDDADDLALVQRLSDRIRTHIQEELDDLLLARRSVWFG
jgi:1-acyl-sn-glycerol-3-phosphate acyltransferase